MIAVAERREDIDVRIGVLQMMGEHDEAGRRRTAAHGGHSTKMKIANAIPNFFKNRSL